jgi:hypothetical protein
MRDLFVSRAFGGMDPRIQPLPFGDGRGALLLC